MKSRESSGFTLIEVLIALLIVGIAIAALVETVIQQSKLVMALRDRTVAHWVAMNKASEYELYRVWPEIGRSDGTVTMGGREWKWELSVAASQLHDLRRIEIRVAPASGEADATAELVDYILPPMERGAYP